MDEQLVELVNCLSEKSGKKPLDLTPEDVDITTDIGTSLSSQHRPVVTYTLPC
jgi:hypothetical protein